MKRIKKGLYKTTYNNKVYMLYGGRYYPATEKYFAQNDWYFFVAKQGWRKITFKQYFPLWFSLYHGIAVITTSNELEFLLFTGKIYRKPKAEQ